MIEKMNLLSAPGKNLAVHAPVYLPGQESELVCELGRVEKLRAAIAEKNDVWIEKLCVKLSQVWDILATFSLLEHHTIDDIQLFEVKRFALLVEEMQPCAVQLVKQCGMHPAPENFPDLHNAVEILDPRREHLATFYIYSEYNPELKRLRKEKDALNAEELHGAKGAQIQAQCEELEQVIREDICKQLRVWVPDLKKAMHLAGYWDFLIAKAKLAVQYKLVQPVVVGGTGKGTDSGKGLKFKGLFHPAVREILENEGKSFQPVDVELRRESCLLTGANMSGKTVLLKSLYTAQTLLQRGIPVPAQEAEMPLFHHIELLVLDRQDEEKGLSSFGAEIERLNGVLAELKEGKSMLLLMDEPARTTNPVEGKAIVSALAETVKKYDCVCLISTHYGPFNIEVRRMRVRGLLENGSPTRLKEDGPPTRLKEDGPPVRLKEDGPPTRLKEDGPPVRQINLNGRGRPFPDSLKMDYSLVEETPGAPPPREALRIAQMLNFDPEVLALAQRSVLL